MVNKTYYRVVTLLAMTLFIPLSSCTHEVKDGPPKKSINLTRVQNAKPKKEPLSRYGNPKKYTVFGKTYYPQKKIESYTKVGTASWYGTKFDGQRTSSGEVYDMLKMTAAHKTLPLPTYLKVTNLENKKEIIVKVNDRGPFKDDRILDLSYAAAYKLDMLRKGTAHVKVEAINLDLHKKTTRFASNLKLQVAALKDKNNANTLAEKIKKEITKDVFVDYSDNNYYRVTIGPIYDSEDDNKNDKIADLSSKIQKLLNITPIPKYN